MSEKYSVIEYIEDNGQTFKVMRPRYPTSNVISGKDQRGDDAF